MTLRRSSSHSLRHLALVVPVAAAMALVAPSALAQGAAKPAAKPAAGKVDPKKAAEGTIRKDFATDIEKNTVHGSDSGENARVEISYFFPEVQVHAYDWKKLT